MRYLAVDLGASSGRGRARHARGRRDAMPEVHRFRTPLVEDGGHLYWDVEALWREIQLALHLALDQTPLLRSVSVDSWAVDYQPLDASGRPTRRPYAYRDTRTHGQMHDALSRAGGAAAVYARTGIQLLPFNTLVQVVADLDDEPELVARTATRLLLADYFLYRLSGLAVAERTIASSTQLVDATSGLWAKDLIHALGDDPARWAPIVAPGTALGPVQRELVPHSVRELPRVIASCSPARHGGRGRRRACDRVGAVGLHQLWHVVSRRRGAPRSASHRRCAQCWLHERGGARRDRSPAQKPHRHVGTRRVHPRVERGG